MNELRGKIRSHLEYLSLFEDALPWPQRSPSGSVVNCRSLELPGAISPLPQSLDAFEREIHDCHKCPLHKTRTKFVFGDGNPHARVVFVGEAPGQDEDLQGKPFVGRAGQLLNRLLEGAGFKREEVYICNVLKSRPPANRDPLPEEVEACRPWLMTQLAIISPQILVCLGRHAAMALLKTEAPMKELRGKVLSWNGIQVLVTYHPAYFLRSIGQLPLGEEDFRRLRELYDAL